MSFVSPAVVVNHTLVRKRRQETVGQADPEEEVVSHKSLQCSGDGFAEACCTLIESHNSVWDAGASIYK